jgi:hypothetical protein
LPILFPQCSHITRKRGIFHYRRRLPGEAWREVTISLCTRHFREAEHRAGLVDRAFHDALARARQAVSEAPATEAPDLGPILRDYLRKALERDLDRRMDREAGSAVYAHWWEPGDPGTAQEADLKAIREARASMARDLADNRPQNMAEEAEALIRRWLLSGSRVMGPITRPERRQGR